MEKGTTEQHLSVPFLRWIFECDKKHTTLFTGWCHRLIQPTEKVTFLCIATVLPFVVYRISIISCNFLL